MKQLVTALVAAIALLAPSAQAHFIFLELNETGLAMRLAEAPGEKSEKALQEKAKPMAVKTDKGEAIETSFGENALAGKVGAETKVVSGSLEYGILDREAQGRGVFMLMYHAKGARTAADAATKLGLPVEIVVEVVDKELKIQVLKNGEPAPAAELTVYSPGADDIELDADDKGQAKLPLPGTGLLGVRAMVREDKAGESGGKPYTFIRHYSTLTFHS
jgi:uncharacterized GH25 family protein